MKEAIRLAETRRDPRQVTCGYEQGGKVREAVARRTQLCASYCRFCHPSQGECDGDGEGSVDNDASSALSSALSLSLCRHVWRKGEVDERGREGRARGRGRAQTSAMVIVNDNASTVSSSSRCRRRVVRVDVFVTLS